MQNIFTHGGDVGDLVYAMPTIRALGGGKLVLWPRRYVREPFTPEKVEKVATFFASQPYIHSVQFKTQECPTHNLDDFRATWLALRRRGAHGQYNLAELHLLSQNLSLAHAADKWLDIDTHVFDPSYSVVFNRTFRYRNHRFPWNDVWDKFRNVAVFLGTRAEWQEFSGNVGTIRYQETPTLLDAARIIAGCKLYVGNQSALMAVAIGLKVPTILQESWLSEPNCLFPWVTSVRDENVNLPDL
jgi:hypothetical protein